MRPVRRSADCGGTARPSCAHGRGREANGKAAPAHFEAVRRIVFDGVTVEQLAALSAVAEQVSHRLDATAGSPDAPAVG
jgi:hypothetical protein